MSLLLLLNQSGPTTQPGVRSLFAFWMGGAGNPPAQAGVRSMLAFWMGGATLVATAPGDGGARRRRVLICGGR
jgi:hypothetical protein